MPAGAGRWPERAPAWLGRALAGDMHEDVDNERLAVTDRVLGSPPELCLARGVQRADERSDVCHAEPPRRQLGRGGQPGGTAITVDSTRL